MKSRRAASLVFAAAMIVLAAGASRAEQAASAPGSQQAAQSAPPLKPADIFRDDPGANQPVVSPFGDRYDPNKPPPVAPETTGPGITSATLVAAGAADLKEVPKPPSGASVFYAVVVDVTIPKGSTTGVLGPASITLTPAPNEKAEKAEPAALFAACMPTLDDADAIQAGEGTKMAAWTVLIGERSWRCGDRTARMAQRVGPGGFKLTAARADLSGQMVLLFEGQVAPPKSVTIAGKIVELPARQEEKKN